jgi:hypothetical protein
MINLEEYAKAVKQGESPNPLSLRLVSWESPSGKLYKRPIAYIWMVLSESGEELWTVAYALELADSTSGFENSITVFTEQKTRQSMEEWLSLNIEKKP